MQADILNTDQINDACEILEDKFHDLIKNYLAETETLLLEIDIYRAGEQDARIMDVVHQLKSSSFQVGARQVMAQSENINYFIHNNLTHINSMPIQMQLDNMVSDLRNDVQKYRTAIFQYLQK